MKHLMMLIIVLSVAFKTTAQQWQTITNVQLTDFDTRTPIENAVIKNILLKKQLFQTDELGRTKVSTIIADSNTLEITHELYGTNLIKFKAESNQKLELRLFKKQYKLQPITITVPFQTTYNKISAVDIATRPINTSQDALRIVPGLFLAQHAGGGKAEQIFLRGYDIDHGTDVSIEVDGLPVNMVSHAHGQGYSDLHFVIPETVEKVNFDKGPYQAEKGNMATAGYVEFKTKNKIEANNIKVETGRFNSQRLSSQLKLFSKQTNTAQQQLYVASEYHFSDGYFESPQNLNRANIFAKYFYANTSNLDLTIIASGFKSKWNASGQIPETAVNDKIITRFGAIDATEGGNTSRINFSIQANKKYNQNLSIQQQLNYTKYTFDLYSNFTFFLNDSLNGDMINQKESRQIFGYKIKANKKIATNKFKSNTELGAGVRHDLIDNISLATAPKRIINNYLQLGDVKETNAYTYLSQQITFAQKWQINASLRFDHFRFGYNNQLINNSYEYVQKNIVSPKIQLQYNASQKVQFFVKNGVGFHSNDSRLNVDKSVAYELPKVFSTDLGANITLGKKTFIQTTLWHSYAQQEFVYVGDEGIVEANGPSRRLGAEASIRHQFNKILSADIDVNFANAKFVELKAKENYIPLAPLLTSTGGVTAKFKKGVNASLRYRYIGDRPANEDFSSKADGYLLLDAVINYSVKNYNFSLSSENLLNSKWKEAQFETTSRLQNEPERTEMHYTPGSPFFIKFGVSVRF